MALGIAPDAQSQLIGPLDLDWKHSCLGDRSLFMTGGGVAESNDFLRKIFLRPTLRAEKHFRGLLGIPRKFFDAHSYR